MEDSNDRMRKQGGSRPNAGRKPKDPSGKKVQASWALAPDVLAIIQNSLNQAEYIESAIREKHRMSAVKRLS